MERGSIGVDWEHTRGLVLADTSGVKWSAVAAVFRSDLSCPLRTHPPLGPDLPKLLRRQTCLLCYKTKLATHSPPGKWS